ncbi:MAG: (2Fe-2S)-binding protein [Methylophaga sp.]|nr:MAG: (2Fe-2S)-binding protein [Methylophaga sp.]
MAEPKEKKDIICVCTGTTKQKIIQLIENGATDIDKIASATGATTGCASCDVSIIELIDEHANVN